MIDVKMSTDAKFVTRHNMTHYDGFSLCTIWQNVQVCQLMLKETELLYFYYLKILQSFRTLMYETRTDDVRISKLREMKKYFQ